jgi:ribosomal-protein-alanine N-acetyltransferase
MDESKQGQGLMTEAVVAAVGFAFDGLDLHRVQAAIMPRNRASQRVVEKVGFRSEGLAQRYLCIAGAWEDHLLFGLTSEEWPAGVTVEKTQLSR